jgi:hypothetical protein
MEPGYYYIVIDGFQPTINPDFTTDFLSPKKVAVIGTVTKTITQHWPVHDTDKSLTMRWSCLDVSDKDSLLEKYEGDYTSYVFLDVYGDSHNVVITDFTAERIGELDEYGFQVTMTLQKV